MSPRQFAELLLLAALWGGSFIFMRLAVPEFGTAALVFVRVACAAAFLLPLLLMRGNGPVLLQHWRPIAVVGVLNTALPFLLFTAAAHVLSAGLMSIFNATTPIWGALIAWWWLGEKPLASRVLGLFIGVAGVVGLAWGKADFTAGSVGISPAGGVMACLAATLFYGIAGHYARQKLKDIPPLAVATGSQLAAAVVLLVPAWVQWPAAEPSATAWGASLALALACTALAYQIYFRLIAQVGASKSMAVTFLIPVFGMTWGGLFLGEAPTAAMLAGGAVILLGTALATGLLKLPVGTQSSSKA